MWGLEGGRAVRDRLRGLLLLFAFGLAFALLWQRVRIILVWHIGWLQFLAILLGLTLVIFLILDFVLDRLGR